MALDQRELRAHRIATEDDQRIADLERAWGASTGIVIGTDVDEAFTRWMGSGTWTQTGAQIADPGKTGSAWVLDSVPRYSR